MEEAHEVEIKLKGHKIIEACKNINKDRVVIEASNDTIKDFLYIIEKVFSNDNVEVTAKDLSAEEKRSLMNIIRKNLYNRSIFDRKIERLMQTLKVAISIGKEDIIEKKAISTINELIEKNVFEAQKCGVYENMTENPAHLSESSLDSTVFKLAVKTANTAVGATELLQVASKQIDSYVYSRVFKEDKELADLMSIKEHYSDENGLYDLDELYSETLGNGKSLVEHGLQIIYEKANEIKELRKAIEDSNGNPDDIQKIFSANFIDKNDLKILMSLMQHKDKIRKERSIFRSIHRIIAENNMQNTETARLDKTVDEVDFSNHGSVWDIMESIITPVDVQLLAQCSKMRTEIEKSTENYENYDAEIKKWQAEKSNVSGYKTKLNAKKKKKRELKEINESNIKKLEELKAKLEKFGL
ncbi:hypothetical protein NEMIN01_2496, partial [Nematocida minor]|uniref:uncharacterized protein n=1 Tax=Nematocida minor TaxID=1912983 RepID=UPI00221EDD96